MESNLNKNFIGKLWLAFLTITWTLVLIIIPYSLVSKKVKSLDGFWVMLLGFFILIFSKRAFLLKREYWKKFGFQYLENTNRNLYFFSYFLMYIGFILCFV